ncbi:hypothetical protein KOR42_46060 [Thalassoglobus neptunius]|uniref:Glycosyltransferase RgtA/B/C/D-like domain-containing protein n=1 Tax=Thalassoglobus neptunius TaxID=1938619 RepID=A0A5C5VWF1_9PLAN|nr:hypothetical protein KOR42_46060 [Thalassoglobus neptunius]
MNIAQTSQVTDSRSSFLIPTLTSLGVLVLLALRVWRTGLLGDELLFVHAIDLGVSEGLFAVGSSHPPFVRLLVSLFADGESPDWLLRLPSVLMAVATVFVWDAILRRLVPDRWLIALLLPAMALSPVWLTQGFQCLPYAALALFSSLHCLAWMGMLESDRTRWKCLFIASGILLPWTHFFGINVLLVDQLIWGLFLLKRKVSIKAWLTMNAIIAALTLPVVPIATFYVRIESTFDIKPIADFDSYFVPVSSLFFSYLTFSVFTTYWPTFLILYAAAAVFLGMVIRSKSSSRTEASAGESDEVRAANNPLNDWFGCIAVGFLLAGFGAGQLHSWIGQSAMWPRYMLAGSWIHLPLIAFFLWKFVNRTAARVAAGVGLLCALVGSQYALQVHGTDCQRVASELRTNWQSGDRFLEQGVDIWSGENHFDRLWFRRYVSPEWPLLQLPTVPRESVLEAGLQFDSVPEDCKRIWVFSHLFADEFHERQNIPGWELKASACYGDACPLAVYVRIPTDNEHMVSHHE